MEMKIDNLMNLIMEFSNQNQISIECLHNPENSKNEGPEYEIDSVFQTNLWIAYQREYQKDHVSEFINIRIKFSFTQDEIAMWDLFLINEGTDWNLGNINIPIRNPVFKVGVRKELKNQIYSTTQSIMQKILSKREISSIKYSETFIPDKDHSVDLSKLNANLANVTENQILYLDLGPDLSSIKSIIRKSYKSLINKGEKLWKLEILTFPNQHKWEEFYNLHVRESGRITRSKQSWNAQYRMVEQACAFAVLAEDENSELVGCGFFYNTSKEALYFTGAHRRDLFPLPIGHAVQFRAIKEMKDRSIKWYRLGTYFDQHNLEVDQKEKNISLFKKGFSSHVILEKLYSFKIIE
jgi:FemAB family protein